MKKNLFYLFALICSMSLLTACSDDDDNKINSPVVGTWNLAPVVAEDGNFISGPVSLTWKAPEGTMVGFLPVADLPAFVEPLVSAILPQVLKDVTFGDEGDILATYSDAEISLEGDAHPNWVESGKGFATYKVVSDTKILVFLNLDKIATARAEMDGIADLLTNGIPVNVEWAADKKSMTCYIDKALMTQLSGVLASVIGALPDGTLGEMEGLLKPIILGLPAAMAVTTEFKLGLNFKK